MVARCDGVPLYIEQLVRGVREKPADGSPETRVPDALYEPLFARLRASASVVPVVEAAGIIGRDVDRGLLCSVVDLSEDEVDDVIDELEDALVLEPWGADGWRFRHELLREVAAEVAPPSVRRGLHAKVADALVHGAGRGRSGLGAGRRPLRAGQRFDEAAWAYQQASAAAARRRGALAEARTYLTLALAVLDRTTPGPDRDRREIAVRLERGFLAAALEGNQTRAAVGDFERCLQLGGTDLGDKELVATMVALMVYYFTRADLRRVVEVLEALRAGLKQGRQWLRPVIEASFGVVAWHRGEFDAASSRLEQAMASLAASGPARRGVVSAQRPDRDGARCTWPWRGSCAVISAAPRPSWRKWHTGWKGSVFPRVRSARLSRVSWRSGCASRPVSSTGPRCWPPT